MLTSIPKTLLANDRFEKNIPSFEGAGPHKSAVHLYFSNKENSFLTAEEQTLLLPVNTIESCKIIIENLIKGPREGLMKTIPPGTELRALYFSEKGTAYVDFSAELKGAHPGGIDSEIMTIFSVVNSLILNLPEIKAVKILIDGSETSTLAGHIDLRFPFKANMILIR